MFLSKNLRRLSASVYLAALSASDSMVLLVYVLLDWLVKGLPYWPGGHSARVIHTAGGCHLFLFFSYTFRFVSVWLIVVFTIERFIAVCRPLHRRIICTKAFARRIILTVCLMGALCSLYKPILSGVYPKGGGNQTTGTGHGLSALRTNGKLAYKDDDYSLDAMSSLFLPSNVSTGFSHGGLDSDELGQQMVCAANPDYRNLNFVLDATYAMLITAVPFLVITMFNMIIMRKLVNRGTFQSHVKIKFRESRVRLEFTVTLLVVSSSFICLNLPYFVVWCQHFTRLGSADQGGDMLTSSNVYHDQTRSQLLVTKTIFNVNYCINFFLYCVTGTYYRGEIRSMFKMKPTDNHYSSTPLRKTSTSTSVPTTCTLREFSTV